MMTRPDLCSMSVTILVQSWMSEVWEGVFPHKCCLPAIGVQYYDLTGYTIVHLLENTFHGS